MVHRPFVEYKCFLHELICRSCCDISVSAWQERRRAHHAARAAALQTAEASKRSLFEQRSRFQRALGALEVDESSTALEEDSFEEADTSVSTGYDGCVLQF